MKDFRVLALICTLIGGMGQGVVAPKLPELLRESSRLALDSGLSAALMYFGIFLTTFQFGKLADRGRVHWLLGPGLMGYALILICFGWVTSTGQVFALRFAEGIFLSAIFVAADFILGRLSAAKERGRWLSYYGVALGAGLLLGPALSLAFSRLWPPLAVVATAAVVLAFITFRERVGAAGEEDSDLSVSINRAALATAVAYGFMEAGLVAVFPVLAVREFHLPPEYCLIAIILIAALSSVVWGDLSDRVGARRIMNILLIFMALGPLIFMMGPLQSAIWVYCSCILFGILAGGIYPVGFSWLLEGLPESRYGFASGAFARAYGLGSLLGPLLCGILVQRFHSQGLFAAVSGAGLLCLLAVRLRSI